MEPKDCQLCGSDVSTIIVTDGMTAGKYDGKRLEMCEICYSTIIGNALQFPHQYDSLAATMFAQVGNRILERMKQMPSIDMEAVRRAWPDDPLTNAPQPAQ